jgi:hypothetical protein
MAARLLDEFTLNNQWHANFFGNNRLHILLSDQVHSQKTTKAISTMVLIMRNSS